MARCVWTLASEDITEFIANIQEPHARGWLAVVLRALPHEELTRVVVTLWAMWHARRKAILEIFQRSLSTHSFVDRFLADLRLSIPVPKERPMRPSLGPKWIPPPLGLFKVNVDAAMSKNSLISSFAAVVVMPGENSLVRPRWW
jgi:hypothetical protein